MNALLCVEWKPSSPTAGAGLSIEEQKLSPDESLANSFLASQISCEFEWMN